jgi:hypothetical protein
MARFTVSLVGVPLASYAEPADSLKIDSLNMKVLVPAYFDPSASNYWSRLAAQAAKMPGRLYAIANPDNGPGSSREQAYTSVMATMQSNGGKVIGYVWTNYGAVSISTVESQIDQWYSYYPSINGIFLDCQANVTGQESYYLQLYGYVKQKDSSAIVVGNPGTNTIESYLFDGGQRVTDVVCIFETNTGFDSWTPSSWTSKYDRSNFYVIPYNRQPGEWLTAVNRAASLNVGWIYCTDATLPNPYNTLPSYFEEMCNYLVTGIDSTTSVPTGELITIDGHFTDWTGIPALAPQPNYPSPYPASDILNVWAANDTSNLFLSYQVAGSIDATNYYYHIFIDIDHDSLSGKSGYVYNDSASIGAEYMVENSSLWKYSGTGGANWAWVGESGMQKADSAGRTELSIPLNLLFQGNSAKNFQLIFEVNQATSPFALVDIAPADYQTESYFYQAKITTDVRNTKPGLPSSFTLLQNYPNPFNPATVISYQLAVNSFVTVKVYDELGREITRLVNGDQSPGSHSIRWDGANFSSGVYFYELSAGNFHEVKKMVLMK